MNNADLSGASFAWDPDEAPGFFAYGIDGRRIRHLARSDSEPERRAAAEAKGKLLTGEPHPVLPFGAVLLRVKANLRGANLSFCDMTGANLYHLH